MLLRKEIMIFRTCPECNEKKEYPKQIKISGVCVSCKEERNEIIEVVPEPKPKKSHRIRRTK